MDILPWRYAACGERLRNDEDREEVCMPEQTKIAEELKKMEYEPMLPVENKLIGWSIVLGAVLLGILVWISYTFFPGQ